MNNHVLTDDHIDLIISAALRWNVLASSTTAAFSTHASWESRIISLTATQAGRAIRDQNGRALLQLSQQGRLAMSDQIMLPGYDFRPTEAVDPLEVAKAIQAARSMCQDSPDWETSPACQLLNVLTDSAICRLPGYAVAPWHWVRPERHNLGMIGIHMHDDGHPDIDQVQWVSVDHAEQVWEQAAMVLVTVPAALHLPPGLRSRPGVHVLTWDPIDGDQVWAAVTAVGQQALILSWPHCQEWVSELVAGLPQPEPAR